MGLLDRLFKKTNNDLKNIVHHQASAAIGRIRASNRQTRSIDDSSFFLYEGLIPKGEFRTKNVMNNLKLIRDMNPDAGMAVWNFLRLANNSHELEALQSNGKPEKSSTDLINKLAGRVGEIYGGGTDQLINVLLISALTYGAIALEVELNESLTDVVDFHAVDPTKLDFRRDKETGELQLVQKQPDGTYKVLNRETVFYQPFDSDIEDPYGRPPFLSVLQVVFFQMEVLRDLRRAVHHQGYERFDISVVEEAIIQNMPEEVKSEGPEAIARYVSSYVDDIQYQMKNLEPDDDFFHTDSVQINTAGGTMKGSLDARAVIEVINQQITTALKQMPILLGRNDTVTEAHGTVQWQIYVAGIESVQRVIKRIMEKAYNVALQIYGKPRTARLTFNTIRVNDRLKEAQAEETETRVKITQQLQGWIDNDEAAEEMVGHKAVNDPVVPFKVSTSMQPNAGIMNPDIGSSSEEDRLYPRKKFYRTQSRADQDEFVSEMGEGWSSELAQMASSAAYDYHEFLKEQRDRYIKRLREAGEIPSRVEVDISCLKKVTRADDPIPDPSDDFEDWVRTYILYDSEEYTGKLAELQMDLLEEAVYLTGSSTLIDLDIDYEFDMKDENLLRWLSDRSRRDAELIQGVSDERVIMTLWDVVYDEKYSIDKAEKALREEFAFSKNRARTIARTEIISAGRSGQYHADVQSGMVIGKIWQSTLDQRTRKGHQEADQQVVRLNEPFSVANKEGQYEMLMFPGDTSLGSSPDNVIQCRCWYKRILEGEEDLLKG
ncbi:phage minor head protein [Fictibacillus sp. NRS-1165]|uniref:phage minor head protein n=1 Tax=Fictibacillus sp. NRS-1165 TaxID=3144463 RepID=UPI003D229C06